MTVKNATLVALIGMLLLSVLLLLSFVNSLTAFVGGLIPLWTFVSSLIQLLASLAVTLFFFVFYQER